MGYKLAKMSPNCSFFNLPRLEENPRIERVIHCMIPPLLLVPPWSDSQLVSISVDNLDKMMSGGNSKKRRYIE